MTFQFIKNSKIIIDFEKLCLNQITHFKPIKKTLVQKSCRANYSINRLMCFEEQQNDSFMMANTQTK